MQLGWVRCGERREADKSWPSEGIRECLLGHRRTVDKPAYLENIAARFLACVSLKAVGPLPTVSLRRISISMLLSAMRTSWKWMRPTTTSFKWKRFLVYSNSRWRQSSIPTSILSGWVGSCSGSYRFTQKGSLRSMRALQAYMNLRSGHAAARPTASAFY